MALCGNYLSGVGAQGLTGTSLPRVEIQSTSWSTSVLYAPQVVVRTIWQADVFNNRLKEQLSVVKVMLDPTHHGIRDRVLNFNIDVIMFY